MSLSLNSIDNIAEVSVKQKQVRTISLWNQPDMRRPHRLSFGLALVLHASFLLFGGFAFVKPAEYGIEASQGGMEVYMVAALPKEISQGTETVIQSMMVDQQKEADWVIAKPAVEPVGKKTSQEKTAQLRTSEDSEYVGDGSSPVPGLNKTTFYSPGGSSTDERPGYLKNPPPPYPKEAIEQSQEGLVLLSATIDRVGRPRQVTLKQSSGFSLLDKSALKTVKEWKFSPGRLGFLSSESQIIIPIRFQLKDVIKFKSN